MKKRLFCVLLATVFVVGLLSACTSKDDTQKTAGTAEEQKEEKPVSVTLNEVAHSIFYAPQYVAIEKGYFKDEGIDLTLVTGFGADKVMTAVLSGEADIGFMGSESSIYTCLLYTSPSPRDCS